MAQAKAKKTTEIKINARSVIRSSCRVHQGNRESILLAELLQSLSGRAPPSLLRRDHQDAVGTQGFEQRLVRIAREVDPDFRGGYPADSAGSVPESRQEKPPGATTPADAAPAASAIRRILDGSCEANCCALRSAILVSEGVEYGTTMSSGSMPGSALRPFHDTDCFPMSAISLVSIPKVGRKALRSN